MASQWFDLMPPDHARARKERFLDRLGETRFAWSGPLTAGSDVSWYIQGPSAIYREPGRDYGEGIGDRSRRKGE